MKVSKNSWHYKLNTFKTHKHPPSNRCDYIIVTLNKLTLVTVVMFCFVSMPFVFFIDYSHGFFRQFVFLCGCTGWAALMAAALLLLIIYFDSLTPPKISFMWIDKLHEQWIKIKQKYCTPIEFIK